VAVPLVEECDIAERGDSAMRNQIHRLLALWIALILVLVVELAFPALH
jgi:hypothetical protein